MELTCGKITEGKLPIAAILRYRGGITESLFEVVVARSKSSARWLKEHFDDRYVQLSKKDGYRSRASYKLVELNSKDQLIRPGMLVVDLGAAPGGWCQVVRSEEHTSELQSRENLVCRL